MLYNFDTESIKHAKAALLLYAIYKSRGSNSPLNGLETWDRFNSFVRASCIKSKNTAEFVQNFCKKAGIGSIKPVFLQTEEPVKMQDGELMFFENLKNFRIDVFNDELLELFRNETIYLIMLVRERIQREKVYGEELTENED